jgi:hypothetical protein
MATTYELADEDVVNRMQKVLRKYHGNIGILHVNVGVLMATNPEGPAVTKTGGYPCAAKVRIVSLKDRAAGMPDAQIIIDALRWEELTAVERDALLDHELEHLQPALDKDGKPKQDDLGRPKLKMKLHDAEIGIFRSVVERYGPEALDAQIAEKFIDEWGQLLMWAKDKETVG